MLKIVDFSPPFLVPLRLFTRVNKVITDRAGFHGCAITQVSLDFNLKTQNGPFNLSNISWGCLFFQLQYTSKF